jgi:hypothetical protein
MRRRLLATTMALGLVVTAMGFTGIYAVFTDRATTGTNSAESGTQPKAADLKIAFDVTDSTCAGISYGDDLASGVIDATDLQPDYNGAGFNYVCLQNVGTATLSLTATAIDVVETETGCTGDEAAAGDATCGTAGVGDGELGTVLNAQLYRFDCVTGDGPSESVVQPIETIAATPGSLGTLAPNQVACVRTAVIFPGPDSVLTVEAVQRAQSDKVQWRFAFDGTAS